MDFREGFRPGRLSHCVLPPWAISEKAKGRNAMIEWVSKKGCREKVAEVPDNWLVKFAAAQPQDTRKFGDARNSTMLFRTAAVLAAVEDGKYFQSSVEEAAKKAVSL